MGTRKKIMLPLIAVFVIFSGSLIASKTLLAKWGIDHNVLMIANVLFFMISMAAFFIQQKALRHNNPNVFVRSIMGGMMIKIFVCIAAVILYRLVDGSGFSKVSVFAAMFLYLIYLAVEVAVITKLNKQQHA